MNNQNCYDLSSDESQLLLSLYLGDGSYIKSNRSNNYSVQTSCIHSGLLDFKKSLCSTIKTNKVQEFKNHGYNENGKIFKLYFKTNPLINFINSLSFEEKINSLNDLGFALWLYDDGSLHKKKLFYNICTHAFSYEENEKIVRVLNNNFGIIPRITLEKKKDGRTFFYLRVNKYDGADIISSIMERYKIVDMNFKIWNSEAVREWNILQEEWKSPEVSSLNITFKEYVRKRKSIRKNFPKIK